MRSIRRKFRRNCQKSEERVSKKVSVTFLRKGGFTLIETLVAISVLMIAVTGPLVLAQQGLRGAFHAKDQVTATFLAQEGVELVRYHRDTNLLAGTDWLSGLDSCLGGSTCKIDAPTLSVSSCGSECEPLKFDEEGGFYHYGSQGNDPDTKYVRSVELTQINEHEIEVNVTVSWEAGVFPQEFSIRENLFRWK